MSRVNIICHNDCDGIAAAFIVRRLHPKARIFTSNYGLPFPEQAVENIDTLYVVDFSFDQKLERLRSLEADPRFELVWIDHHKIVDDAVEVGFNPKGLRRIDCSAARLAWEYCFPGTPIPKAVQYVSDYDTWDWWRNKDIRPLQFHYGLTCLDFHPTKRQAESIWNLCVDDEEDMTEKVVMDGKYITDFIEFEYEQVVKDGAFETELDGHSAIACNIKNANSLIFSSLQSADVHLMILYARFVEGYRVAVFVPDKYTGVVSAADVCRAHGGGGHDGAAGFECGILPFRLPSSDQEHPVDLYHPIKTRIDQDTTIRQYMIRNQPPLILSHRYPATVAGYSAICVNNPVGMPDGFTMTSDSKFYQIGVFYAMMANGKYRYRVYVLDKRIDIPLVASHIPGCRIIDDSICFIADTTPDKLTL